MIVSWNWLKQYVPLRMSVEELTRRLTMAGLNHEETFEVDGDLAIDLEVTSNRPDCLGHIGVAREVAALWDLELTLPAARPPEEGPPVEELTSVELACPELCPLYTARVIQGVKVGESPAWLRRRLKTAGISSVNNVVDATNYVMLECGQPLHAFDLDRLEGQRIVVRRPHQGETLLAINHRTYELEPWMCAIADARRVVGLGGVMGGAETEVSPQTTNLLIEAARFDPVTIRNTARRLNLHSPSSYRFERGPDPRGVDWASRRCCELILEVAGGTLARGVIAVGEEPPPQPKITLRLSQLPRVLGIEVPQQTVVRILRALGMEPKLQNGTVQVVAPSWRRDLEREIDLVEEVARLHGYDKIPEDASVPLAPVRTSPQEQVIQRVQQVLVAAGFHEALTPSVVDESHWRWWHPWTSEDPLCTQTPVLGRARLLRQTLVPSLLDCYATNEKLGNEQAELFEVARVYLPQPGSLPQEPLLLALVSQRDYASVLGVLQGLVHCVTGQQELTVRPAGQVVLSSRSAQLWLGQELLGYLGQVTPEAAKALDVRRVPVVAELRLEVLLQQARLVPRYTPVPDTPAMRYDVNYVVPSRTTWAQIKQVVQQAAGELLERLQYRETYLNQQLAQQGRKKVLFSLWFRAPGRTLTHDEANRLKAQIDQAAFRELQAQLG